MVSAPAPPGRVSFVGVKGEPRPNAPRVPIPATPDKLLTCVADCTKFGHDVDPLLILLLGFVPGKVAWPIVGTGAVGTGNAAEAFSAIILEK